MKRLALFLVIGVALASAQTRAGRGQSDSSTSSSTPVFARGHGFPGRPASPHGPSPVTNLLTLLYQNVNSAEALSNVRKMWETDRWFDFAHFQETAKTVADIMRQAG